MFDRCEGKPESETRQLSTAGSMTDHYGDVCYVLDHPEIVPTYKCACNDCNPKGY